MARSTRIRSHCGSGSIPGMRCIALDVTQCFLCQADPEGMRTMPSSEVRAQGRLHVTGYQFAAPRIVRATAHRHYTWCNRGPDRSPYVVAEAETNIVKGTAARMFTRPKWMVP